jgi:hypothetical protein
MFLIHDEEPQRSGGNEDPGPAPGSQTVSFRHRKPPGGSVSVALPAIDSNAIGKLLPQTIKNNRAVVHLGHEDDRGSLRPPCRTD